MPPELLFKNQASFVMAPACEIDLLAGLEISIAMSDGHKAKFKSL